MKKVYITGVGQDKPGIVAAMTQVIANNKGNIEDSTMTILGSQFASIMVGTFPDDVAMEDIRREYMAVEQTLGLIVFVQELEDDSKHQQILAHSQPYIISVAGNDKTGITFEITRILARHEVNVTDLNAQTIQGEDGPVYIMMVETLLPPALNVDVFEQELAKMGESLNVEVTYHPVEHVAL